MKGTAMLAGLACGLVGCSFQPGTFTGDGRSDDDGPGMTGSDGPVACTDHVVPPAKNVDATALSASLVGAPSWACTAAGTTTINTATGSIASTSCALGSPIVGASVPQTTGGGTVFVVPLSGLTLGAGHVMNIVGDKPIVFLVAGNVSIDGSAVIDAGAHGVTPGAGGSRSGECTDTTTGRGGAPSGGGWGAGGGGFGTKGGQGCYMIVNGGDTTGTATLEPLRGGCSGGSGGGPSGGAGGGAIEISASGTIAIGATGIGIISAGGGGGPGGPTGGGNGGGSGGAILLVAPTMPTLGAMGALRTHGGAGSEGCSSCTGLDAGGDGRISGDDRALDGSNMAGGGNGNDHGRRGGQFAIVGTNAPITSDGEMASAQNGGRGGGGGGGGRIVLTTGATSTACD